MGENDITHTLATDITHTVVSQISVLLSQLVGWLVIFICLHRWCVRVVNCTLAQCTLVQCTLVQGTLVQCTLVQCTLVQCTTSPALSHQGSIENTSVAWTTRPVTQ